MSNSRVSAARFEVDGDILRDRYVPRFAAFPNEELAEEAARQLAERPDFAQNLQWVGAQS